MIFPEQQIISRLITENGGFPNNRYLPLIIIKQAVSGDLISPENFEKQFNLNSWPAAWRNGLYNYHHYHSTAHEVLGVYSGWVQARFGGPGGDILKAEAGDVIIIPAGVSHCNKGQSQDFMAVGAYPAGQSWDMKYGKLGERPAADHNISNVTGPKSDPLFGVQGPLMRLWQ
ncbi:MAG: hypothetical protein HKP41_23755 [Desulfobacterales bacterium]|nr:hypothetical protein [Deltaproteobacteria bacterium]NNK97382.1 hypothetical protein [Desulfobacterales bacterium]